MAKPPVSLKIIDGSVGALDTGITTPLFTGSYHRKTIWIKTNTNCNIYVKGSPDGENVGFIVSGYSNSGGAATDDGDYVNVCNNETIGIPCDIHMPYMVVVVDNQDASVCTVKSWVSGVGA